MENRILPADELPELNDLNDALVRDGKDAILPGGQDVVNRLRERAESAESRLREWQKALHDLTPGGSEFADDPKRCAEWVKDSRQSQHQAIVRFKTEKKSVESRLTELDKEFTHEFDERTKLIGKLAEAEKKLAELSAIVEPLRELHDDATAGDLSVAHVYHARSILRDKLYEVFPKIAALVPPVEKGEK